MKCKKCKEDVNVGEACIVEASDDRHASFYHTECHAAELTEKQEKRLQEQADCARKVN